MFSTAVAASRRSAASSLWLVSKTRATPTTATTRSVVTVPKLGSQEAMEKEFGEIIRARVARQKQLREATIGDAHAHHTKEVDEMWKWVKISIMIALPLCTISLIKDALTTEHVHRPEGPMPDYMRIRKKNFAWTCSDCDLFDMKCWKKCKAEMKGEAAPAGH